MKRYSPQNQDDISEDFVEHPSRGAQKAATSTSLILGIVVLVLGLGLAVGLYIRGRGSDADRSPKPSPSAGVSQQTKDDVTGAIEQKQPAALDKHLAPRVTVVNVANGTSKTVDAKDVAGLIQSITTAQNPWNWIISPQTLAQWQNGPYGQYITPGSLIGQSADGQVIIINFDSNGQIVSIIIIPNADLLLPTPAVSATPTSQPNGTTDTPPTPTPTPVTTDTPPTD